MYPIGFQSKSDSNMRVFSEDHISLIDSALEVDSSEEMQTHLPLWRGGIMREPSDYDLANKASELFKETHSLSFGSSLFAGALYDHTATAYRYMKDIHRDAYYFRIPVLKGMGDAFIYPMESGLCQLYRRGELFHPRTKVPSGENIGECTGIANSHLLDRRKLAELQSSLEREELEQIISGHFTAATVLTTGVRGPSTPFERMEYSRYEDVDVAHSKENYLAHMQFDNQPISFILNHLMFLLLQIF